MDLDRLLAPISEDQPSGVELRNDARFHAIERLLDTASREHRVRADGSVNESAPPVDWSGVLSQSEELAGDGRDLRLLVIVVRGLFATEGFRGLSQGIGLLQRSIGDYWDNLHPRLRDRDDPQLAAMSRTNALRQLCNDNNGLLGDLRFGIAFSPRGIGPVTYDDIGDVLLSDFDVQSRMASGLSKEEKDAIMARHHDRAKRARAACRAMAAEQGEEVAAMVADIGACLAGADTLSTLFGERGGFQGTSGLSLRELTEFLTNCRRSLETAISETDANAPAAGGNPAAPDDNAPEAAAKSTGPVAANTAANGAVAKPGEINSRGDVELALDRIVAFYERTEPSSPIPHVARRLRRMVAMDFLQLMTEIAPSGLKEFRNIAGLDDGKK